MELHSIDRCPLFLVYDKVSEEASKLFLRRDVIKNRNKDRNTEMKIFRKYV